MRLPLLSLLGVEKFNLKLPIGDASQLTTLLFPQYRGSKILSLAVCHGVVLRSTVSENEKDWL
jgi:hypothetical protein